jgi:CRISPR/Cas system CMR subunit Cmr4 (Cas7 group RAMP superfamily)
MKIVIESDCFTVRNDGKCNDMASWFADQCLPTADPFWKTMLWKNLVILNDLAFKHYALRSTEIRTRMKIENGVAAASGPWNEENLPVDTLLFTVLSEVASQDNGGAAALAAFLRHVEDRHRNICQLGGEQTLGRGLLRLRDLKTDLGATRR